MMPFCCFCGSSLNESAHSFRATHPVQRNHGEQKICFELLKLELNLWVRHFFQCNHSFDVLQNVFFFFSVRGMCHFLLSTFDLSGRNKANIVSLSNRTRLTLTIVRLIGLNWNKMAVVPYHQATERVLTLQWKLLHQAVKVFKAVLQPLTSLVMYSCELPQNVLQCCCGY